MDYGNKFLEVSGYFALPDDFDIENSTIETAMQAFLDLRAEIKESGKNKTPRERDLKDIGSEELLKANKLIHNHLWDEFDFKEGSTRNTLSQVFDLSKGESTGV